MEEILHLRSENAPLKHKNEHPSYAYIRHDLLPRGNAHCVVAQYEIPPEKAAYPYHYHTQNDETFYILSGSGMLRTPEGEAPVRAGEFLFFPAGEKGAHKLTNTSKTELLVYLDFDIDNQLDVVFYPDSGKVGIWGMGINQVYQTADQVDYYCGE